MHKKDTHKGEGVHKKYVSVRRVRGGGRGGGESKKYLEYFRT